jgi:hypothetical protein
MQTAFARETSCWWLSLGEPLPPHPLNAAVITAAMHMATARDLRARRRAVETVLALESCAALVEGMSRMASVNTRSFR